MSDPKLKEAMAEIFGVLKKHDIAGQITLVSKTHSEFRFKIDPTWSCARIEERDGGISVRFRAIKAEVPDKTERHRLAELTAHILFQIRDLCGQNFLMFESLTNQLEQALDIDHKPLGGFEPHRDN